MSIHVCSKCGHAEPIFGAGGGARMAAQYGVRAARRAAARHPHPRGGRRRPAHRGRRPGRPASAAPTSRWRAAPRRGFARRRGRAGGSQDHRRGHLTVSIKSDRWIRRMAAEPRHDRALRARPGARGGRPAHRLLRHLELRLRRALRRRVQDLHQHQLDDRRPEGLRPEELRRLRRATSASSRRTPSRWRARSSTSASRAACSRCASASPPTRAAASSST